jgi:hypothetical protein
MNVLNHLAKLSTTLTDILEDMDEILDNITNTELYSEIDNRVRYEVDNALTNLDVTISDIEDGMYSESDNSDEDDEDYNY